MDNRKPNPSTVGMYAYRIAISHSESKLSVEYSTAETLQLANLSVVTSEMIPREGSDRSQRSLS